MNIISAVADINYKIKSKQRLVIVCIVWYNTDEKIIVEEGRLSGSYQV